jgi:hypothetical protein
MANEFGLLDDRRESLLSVDYGDLDTIDAEHARARVRLAEQWDLAGSGSTPASQPLRRRLHQTLRPEFTMMSLDQKIILNTTVWGNATVITIVIRPDRIR